MDTTGRATRAARRTGLTAAWAVAALLLCGKAADAGPAEDKILRDAAGCLGTHPNPDAVRVALTRGGSPNSFSSDKRPQTPLTCAAFATVSERPEQLADALAVSRMLFDAGAKLGPFDRDILYMPVAGGDLPLVELLVTHGASTTAVMDDATPTELAKRYGHEAVYQYLLTKGGLPVDPRSAAQLVFENAASESDIPGMLKAMSAGAQVNGETRSGSTALMASVRSGVYRPGQAEAVLWLLAHGADPNRLANTGFGIGAKSPPLHVFIVMNSRLMAASAPTQADRVLAAMLKAGAHVSGVDSDGETPLHFAAKFDNRRAAEALIREGAKVMARDSFGKTPLDYAEAGPMIRLLKSHGAVER